MNLDFYNLLIKNILISVPFSIYFILFALQIIGYKDKINAKQVGIFTLIQSTINIITAMTLEQYGLKTLASIFPCIIVVYFIFEIDFFSSIISMIISALFCIFSEILFIQISFYILGYDLNNIDKIVDSNAVLCLTLFYIQAFLIFIFIYYLYKKDIKLIDLKKYKFFSKNFNEHNSDFNDNIKLTAIAIAPIGLFILINYSIYYRSLFYDGKGSSLPYFIINSSGLIVSNIIMFYLAKKVIHLRNYKIEWESQQKYLGDVNELLQRLRAQKHGFINHLCTISGLISLKNYSHAQEYIEKIHETVSTKYNVVSTNNPTINALLNSKASVAESKKVKFEVNIDDNLSELNFKAFEIGEAIGNIIDNAIEATFKLEEESRYVKIDISSDDNFFIFNIENSGKPIPNHLVSKLFDEGFSTKDQDNNDHGFGLFISKHIIEWHKGKIEVQFQNNNISFKIYLPKVIKSEFKSS